MRRYVWTIMCCGLVGGCYSGLDDAGRGDPTSRAKAQVPQIGEHLAVDVTVAAGESATIEEEGAAFLMGALRPRTRSQAPLAGHHTSKSAPRIAHARWRVTSGCDGDATR